MSRPGVDAARLHSEAWDRLDAAFTAIGLDVSPRPAVEPLLKTWKVRHSLAAGEGFFAALATGLGAGRVLLADFTIYPDRISLAMRETDTGSGEVLWADLAEEPVAAPGDSSTGPWLAALSKAAQRLGAGRTERGPGVGGGRAFFLPVRRQGVEESTANLIACCTLRALLRTSWRVQDPGVTYARLRDAGFNPAVLDARARPKLTKDCSDCVLLVTDITTWETVSGSASVGLPADEAPGPGSAQIPPAALSVRLLRADTGDLLYAATEFLDRPDVRGLFGVIRHPSLGSRVQPVIDRLVRAAAQKG